MKNNFLIFTFLAAIAAILYTGCTPPVTPTCETFDTLPIAQYGTVGGTVTNPPGSTIFSIAGGVPVQIHPIYLLPSGPYFNFAGIEAAPASFGSGNVLNTNNVCVDFNFSGKNVQEVTIEYIDMGGVENLWVNGAMYVGELSAAPATLGGATVTVTPSSIPGGNKGKVKIKTATGYIYTFWIGGQEFYLDNLCYQ